MQLPVFPTATSNGLFPYFEGVQWEFKEGSPAAAKLRDTICAMLNTEGGYIVIGVSDDRRVVGISDVQIDRFLLLADGIHHRREIVHEDGSPIPITTVKSALVVLEGKRLVCITACPEQGKQYKNSTTGEMLCRLAASNYTIRSERIYFENDLELVRRQAKAEILEATKHHKAVLAAVAKANRDLAEATQNAATLTRQRDIAIGEAKTATTALHKLQNSLFANIIAEKKLAEERIAAAASPFKWVSHMFSGLLCGTCDYRE